MLELRRTQEFADWLDRLADRVSVYRIVQRLDRIAATGNLGDAKSVGWGIEELRFTFGPGYRVYRVRRGQSVIVLLAGGDKGSQRHDIARARALVARIED